MKWQKEVAPFCSSSQELRVTEVGVQMATEGLKEEGKRCGA